MAVPSLPDAGTASKVSTSRWITGMLMASTFSIIYLVTPVYLITAIAALVFHFPSRNWSYVIASPIFLSVLTKPTASPWIVGMLTPILDYFEYEEIHDSSSVDVKKKMMEGTNYIIAAQPHGVVTFCGICLSVNSEPEFRCKVKTAVASVVLQTPLIKNVMGIFGLQDASATSIKNRLKKKGVEGTIFLYVGGMAELFKSSRKEERLFLSKRKGFIKLALREGVDIIPVYLFGNTSVLTVMKTGPLASLSRKLQVSLTYFWGKYHLPIPRNDKLLYVSGAPLGIPHIPEPTDEDVNKWHGKYCDEVTSLFNKYKEKLPMYKHKTLFID